MSARLTFSNSLEALADRLLENLAREAGDPLRAPVIATPAAAARDWLKIRIAEKSRIAANIAFPHLENLLWERLAERDRERDVAFRQPAKLLDGFSFQGLVLAQLRSAPPQALKTYLDSEKTDPLDRARRLCQLSGRLASLFREYEYNRVTENGFDGVAESWMNGQPCFEKRLQRGRSESAMGDGIVGEVRALESWQMEIYRALFRKGDGLRDRWGEATGVYRYTLPQYAEMALRDPKTPERNAGHPVYHLFGLSNVSPFHRDLIGRLADANLGEAAARFEVYALNPCAEFWEDALTLRERRARGRRRLAAAVVPPERVKDTQPDAEERANGELREVPDENGLLALFGKPGRETIKLWCQLTDHDFAEDFREPGASTLLAAVRTSLLHRTGVLDPRMNIAAQDTSLRLRRAPDVRAEIAAARAEAVALLRMDPSLRPEDMAILAADVETSLPLLRAAFAGGADAPGNAPVLLPDGGEPRENPLLRGLRDLITLGAGSADRRALLTFLDNPVALRSIGLEAARLGAVETFLEAAGFQEGWDRGLKNSIEASTLNFNPDSTLEAAVERALWAFALDANDAGLPESPWPASAATGLDREEISALVDWLEALRTETRALRDGSVCSFAEWAKILRGLRARFLNPGAEDARAEVELSRFFEDLEAWGGWSGGESTEAVTEAEIEADAVLIRMVFEDRFRSAEGAGHSSYLRGGIRVGSLMALRGLPFRYVWIVGLSSGFPAPGEAAPLDLRSYRRLAGESDPASRDLYALLETIATTSDGLSLSWPAHDAGGGELQPSRALTGLMAWLETDVVAEGAPLEFGVMKPPLEPAPPTFPTALTEWAIEPEVEAVQARDLENFVENPALFAATRRFRANAWDALDAEEDERSAALFLDRREDEALLSPALRAELLEAGSGHAVFTRLWTERRRAGRTPPQPYDVVEETRLLLRLEQDIAPFAEALRAQMAEHGLQFAGSLRLGPQGPESPAPPILNLPAFTLDFLKSRRRVGGIFPWFFAAPMGTHGQSGWGLCVEKGKEFPAYLLQLCVAAAAPLPDSLADRFDGTFRLAVVDTNKIWTPPAFSCEEARGILQDLFDDFERAARGEGHLDNLPLGQVEAILKEAEGDPEAIPDWSEALVEARRAAEEIPGARVTRRERLLRAMDTGLSEDATEAVRRRLLPYLKWKRSLYGGKGSQPEDADGEEA